MGCGTSSIKESTTSTKTNIEESKTPSNQKSIIKRFKKLKDIKKQTLAFKETNKLNELKESNIYNGNTKLASDASSKSNKSKISHKLENFKFNLELQNNENSNERIEDNVEEVVQDIKQSLFKYTIKLKPQKQIENNLDNKVNKNNKDESLIDLKSLKFDFKDVFKNNRISNLNNLILNDVNYCALYLVKKYFKKQNLLDSNYEKFYNEFIYNIELNKDSNKINKNNSSINITENMNLESNRNNNNKKLEFNNKINSSYNILKSENVKQNAKLSYKDNKSDADLNLNIINYSLNEKFTDSFFPPNKDSLLGRCSNRPLDSSKIRVKRYESKFPIKANDIIWLRPEDIFPFKKYTLFEGDIEVDDVIQGNIGNCYFLSAIAALCEFPQQILQIFKSLKVSETGYYEVIARIDGEWQVIIVDDYFPCFKSTRKPVFSKPNNSEIWVLILEKVWAKINGGYIYTIGGHSYEVLEVFTPFTVVTFDNNCMLNNELYTNNYLHPNINQKNDFWKTIFNADLNNYILTCSSKNETTNSNMNGLVANHAFTIISAHEAILNNAYTNNCNKLVRLLRIRNPWGYEEWKGAWSDNSKEWDDNAKKAFGEYNNADDGTFFIEYGDFLNYFNYTQICKTMSPLCSKNFLISYEKLFCGNIFNLSLFKKSNVDICLMRPSYRFNRKITNDPELITNLLIFEIKKDNINLVNCINKNEDNPVLSCSLKSGDYIVYSSASQMSCTYNVEFNLNLVINCDNYFTAEYYGVDDEYKFIKESIRRYCIYTKNNNSISIDKNTLTDCNINFDNCLTEIPINSMNIVKTNYDSKNKYFTLNENKLLNKSTFGYYYIFNDSELTITLKIKEEIENFTLFSPNNINKDISPLTTRSAKSNKVEYIIKLLPKSDYLILGDRDIYYNEYIFKVSALQLKDIDIEKYSEGKNMLDVITPQYSFNILMFKNKSLYNESIKNSFNISSKLEREGIKFFNDIKKSNVKLLNVKEEENSLNINYYSFLYKQYSINSAQYTVKIDNSKINEEYFSNKYPDMIKLIKEYKPIHSNVQFMDICNLGYGIYFGEWCNKPDGQITRHGRGISAYFDGSKHCGYYENNEYNGLGEFLYRDGSKIIINFKAGKMHGKGVKIKNKEEYKVEYNNGNLINL